MPGGLKGPISHHYHCPDCLSWVFTRAEGFDWFVNLRAPMLDDASWFEPFVDIWTSEGFSWAETGAKHRYPATPEMADFQMLMEAFAREGARPA